MTHRPIPRRRFSALLAGALAGLIPLAAVLPTHAGELRRGRCYMDTCAWFAIEETSLVASNARGALFRVTLRGWDSHHPGGAYDRRAPRRGGALQVSYAYCSKSRPALLTAAGDGRWEVESLALGAPHGPPGVQETATAIYYAVCHTSAASDPEAFVRLGRRFGYPAGDEAPETAPLARPEDILTR